MSDRINLRRYQHLRIPPEVLDQLPIGTVLISAGSQTGAPETAMRLVQPNDASKYPLTKLTPGGRLLFYFWRHTDGARKALGMASSTKTWGWVIQPDELGFAEIDAFKILCDHRRGHDVPTTLLERAIELAS